MRQQGIILGKRWESGANKVHGDFEELQPEALSAWIVLIQQTGGKEKDRLFETVSREAWRWGRICSFVYRQ